jgi:hypothetical protein
MWEYIWATQIHGVTSKDAVDRLVECKLFPPELVWAAADDCGAYFGVQGSKAQYRLRKSEGGGLWVAEWKKPG